MSDVTVDVAVNSHGTYGEDFGPGFQRHVLAIICRSPLFAVQHRSALDPLFFVSNIDRIVAEALLEFVDEHRVLPSKPTLLEGCRTRCDEATFRTVKQVVAFVYAADVSDWRGVVHKVINFGQTQALCNAVIESTRKIKAGKRHEVRKLITEAEMVGQNILDVGIDFKHDDRKVWYSGMNADDIVQTGIAHLDMALGGGLIRGSLYVILSPPKAGKTTTMVNIGFGGIMSAAGYNVVHVSHEINKHRIAWRYDARLTPSDEVLKLRKTDSEEYARILSDRASKFVQGNLKIQSWPTRTCTTSMLRSYLVMLAGQGFPPDLLLVDYADIMRAERRLGDMRHEQAGIYEDLRGLAGEFNAPVVTASQANKASLSKTTLDIGDFAETFEKAAVMDGGIAFCATPDEKAVGRCRLVLIGLRDEQDGTTVECSIRRDRCMIRSVAMYDPAGVLVQGDGHGLPKPTGTDSGNGTRKKSEHGAGAFRRLKTLGVGKPKAPPTRRVAAA